MIAAVVWAIAVLVIVGVAAWLAKWVIETFFTEPIRTPAMVIVGALLLIILILAVAQIFGAGGLSFGPPFHR